MEESYHVCQICSDPFHTKAGLELHLLQHTSTQFSHKCSMCEKVLRDEHTLKCHVKTVHGEKKFSCDVCGKRFPHRGVLNAHRKTHNRPLFTCEVCNEIFKDSSYFKKHVKSHSGSRPHVCKVCGKSYLQNSHLKVHMSLHAKEKPFECNICQKSFRLARPFKEHLNMHRKVKNFKCTVCEYSSCFHKNLEAHMKNHLKNEISNRKGMKKSIEAPSKHVESKKSSLRNGSQGLNESLESNFFVENIPSSVTGSRFKIKAVSSRSDGGEEPTLDPKSSLGLELGAQAVKTGISLGLEEQSPVFLFVNVPDGDNSLREQIFSIADIDSLEMAQELSISTQPQDCSNKFPCDEYRPLDLTVLPPVRSNPNKLTLQLKNEDTFFNQNSGEDSPGFVEDPGFSTRTEEHFPVFSLRGGEPLEFEPRSGENSPGLNGRYLDFSVDNSGRRRSVFLAEQLEYEHQGEMRVVDPAEVTG